MKALTLFALLVSLSAAAAPAAAQTGPADAGGPGIAVVSHKWRQQVLNPALDEDPLSAGHDQLALDRARKQTIRQNEIRSQVGREQLPLPTTASAPKNDAGITVTYVYEVNLSNTGGKPVRSLVWEYVLFDKEARLEVGRRRFINEASIKPGKSKKLTGVSTSPPAVLVDASKGGKLAPGQFEESVVIQRVEYADGSIWERPSK